MAIRTVHHLNCATLCPIAGRLFGDRGAGFGRGHMVAHCLLIETTTSGLVLVDTGFGTREVAGLSPLPRAFTLAAGPTLDATETALAQVIRLGFTPADVRHVVVTHLDLDHAGGLADFPEARVHLHANEHAAAIARSTVQERGRYLPQQWAHGPKWEVYREDGDTWRGLPAIQTLRGVDAEIGLVPMHGHSRGHSAVIAHAGERWLVHAGDAYFHHASMEGGSVPVGYAAFEALVQYDGVARRASAAALRTLHDRHADVHVFSAHDPAELAALRGDARAATA